MRSAKCEVQSVKCKVLSATCQVGRVMSEVCGVKFELCCQKLSYGIILVMIFKSWGCSEVDFGALGGHFGAQNGHFFSSWVDFDPS